MRKHEEPLVSISAMLPEKMAAEMRRRVLDRDETVSRFIRRAVRVELERLAKEEDE